VQLVAGEAALQEILEAGPPTRSKPAAAALTCHARFLRSLEAVPARNDDLFEDPGARAVFAAIRALDPALQYQVLDAVEELLAVVPTPRKTGGLVRQYVL
jgi:hypothetical protein